MLTKNNQLMYVRNTKYQYYIKGGSISNYSFDLLDEEKTGFLDFLFEKVKYPINYEELKSNTLEQISISDNDFDEQLDKLKSLDIILESNETGTGKLYVLYPKEVKIYFEENMRQFALTGECKGVNYNDNDLYDTNGEQFHEITMKIHESDISIIICPYYCHRFFDLVNTYSVEHEKKIIYGFLDGKEGIVLPIFEPSKRGCYRDFELLRESSFYNLINYQVMKEYLEEPSNLIMEYNHSYIYIIYIYCLSIVQNHLKYSQINSYAYSFDFERMINSKMRMVRFPNCPVCQGDQNITHPFI